MVHWVATRAKWIQPKDDYKWTLVDMLGPSQAPMASASKPFVPVSGGDVKSTEVSTVVGWCANKGLLSGDWSRNSRCSSRGQVPETK